MPAAAQTCTGSSARHARRQQGTHPSVDMTKVVMVRSARLHRSRLGSKRVLLAITRPASHAINGQSVPGNPGNMTVQNVEVGSSERQSCCSQFSESQGISICNNQDSVLPGFDWSNTFLFSPRSSESGISGLSRSRTRPRGRGRQTPERHRVEVLSTKLRNQGLVRCRGVHGHGSHFSCKVSIDLRSRHSIAFPARDT